MKHSILTLILSVFFLVGCASKGSVHNNPDDQRDRRDQAIDELNKETK